MTETQSYDPNLEHQLIELGESIDQASQEASANSGADTKQTTPD
ncbi:hypothetical protein [uncultured Nostoc sp.]